ncbi:MAG: mechanosensitive ion channel domain-containing protein [Alphaproteobacteria bacterium]
MDKLFDTAKVQQLWQHVLNWVKVYALNLDNAVQLGAVGIALVAALALAPTARRGIVWLSGLRGNEAWLARAGDILAALALPFTWMVILWISALSGEQAGWPHHLLTIAVSLLTAWIVIHLATSLIREPAIAKLVTIAVWSAAALNILGLLDPTITLLDSLALNVGGLRISVLTVIKGVFALSVLVWAAMLLARVTEQRISAIGSLTPSLRVLLTKLVKIVLVTIAVAIAISAVGIDLTAFAVFGGAIGIGVGLGLQKSIANLISGVMILLDKSIKPGDVIEVGETYGQVKSLGGRYASVITRDGVEHLIPNEDLIGQKVANWTHSSSEIRLRIPVGVSYNADIRRAMALMEEAAAETERLIKHRPPVVQMKGFGDSSVDLELLVWINDPMNGLANIKSEILLGVWDKFREHGVELPFPQRDLHIRSAVPLELAPQMAN